MHVDQICRAYPVLPLLPSCLREKKISFGSIDISVVISFQNSKFDQRYHFRQLVETWIETIILFGRAAFSMKESFLPKPARFITGKMHVFAFDDRYTHG